jgi:hypothetical protein
LDELDYTLEFIKVDGKGRWMVDNDKWRTWKELHDVLTTLWNQIPVPYFAKRLTNEGKLKLAYEFQKKFLEVLYLFRNYLRLKKCFRMVGGSAKFMILHGNSMEFGRNWIYMLGKRLLFALMDLPDTPRHNILEDHIKQLHFHLLLSMLQTLKTPSISMLAIWVWILNLANILV